MLFQGFHHCRCIFFFDRAAFDVAAQKKKESGLFAFDAVKCYFNVKQAPFFCYFVFHSLSLHSIFFSLSLSLIFRHEVDTRMINMPYAPHSFVLLPSSL